MAPDKIIVAIASLAGMAVTYWFFLMRPRPSAAGGSKHAEQSGGDQAHHHG